MTIEATAERRRALTREERKVIIASSAGTVFEWYDFYLYGALASIIGAQFFAAYSETQQSIFALLTFAAGFIVRPFGAIIFGRLGDIVGRKYTFVVTVVLMGAATFLVGLLPSYHTIGVAAPIALIVLRMLQGLAAGGEYGGAAVYVAEHAPQNQRGFFTSWVNTTPTLALLLSLIVIMFTQIALDAGYPAVVQPDGTTLSAFKAWGWRIPFLLSAMLLLDLALRPPADAGKPGVPAHEGGRRGVGGAAARSVRRVAQHQDRAYRPLRPRRRAGRRLVHGAFLHAVLHPEHSAGRPVHHQRAGRLGARHRRRLRRRLRQPVGPHRPQAADPRRLRCSPSSLTSRCSSY